MTRETEQPEDRLSAALRGLAESSRQGASPELGVALKDAFRLHHRRRKRMQRVGIGIVCLSLAAVAAWFLPRKAHSSLKTEETVVQPIPPQQNADRQSSQPQIVQAPRATRQLSRRNASSPKNAPAAEPFVTLPAFAMMPADDELRVVRLEMPGEDLRLVGAPVTESMARRRVTADFVVGPDGTPYAVRLVQSRY